MHFLGFLGAFGCSTEDHVLLLRNRRNDTKGEVVLYNLESRAVTVQRLPRRPRMDQMAGRDICLFCRRPFDSSGQAETAQPSFMDANYFRLLANATNTPIPSRSPTPTESRPSTPTNPAPPNAPPNANAMPTAGSSSAAAGFGAHLSANAFNQGYYDRFFVEEKKLGRGFRGSVFLCQHVLDQVYLGEYAIKKVAVGDNHAWLVRMLREVYLLEKLHHPNIVDYKHAWLEEHRSPGPLPIYSNGENSIMYIIRGNFVFPVQLSLKWTLLSNPTLTLFPTPKECANGGNLEEYVEPEITVRPTTSSSSPTGSHKLSNRDRVWLLRQQEIHSADSLPRKKKRLTLDEIWSLFLDTCEGLAHLHRQNIVHRDLKPPNLLLSWEDGVRGQGRIPRILISDFGECEVLDELIERDRTGATGTLEFMAPELIKVDEQGKYLREFSPKSDMWSLGMVLYYLCYSSLPYRQVDDVDVLKAEILAFNGVTFPQPNPSLRTDIPEIFKDLMRHLLSPNPIKRPSCDEILNKVQQMRPPPSVAFDKVPASQVPASPGEIPGDEVEAVMDDEERDNSEEEELMVMVQRDSGGPKISRIPSGTGIAERGAGSENEEGGGAGVASVRTVGAARRGEGKDKRQEWKVVVGKRRAVDAEATLSELRKKQRNGEKEAVAGSVDVKGKGKEVLDGENAGMELNQMAADVQERDSDEDTRMSYATPSPAPTTATVKPSTPPVLVAPRNLRLLGSSSDLGIERLLPLQVIAFYEEMLPSEDGWWQITKMTVVVLKVATCIGPCHPYAPSPWVLYPVLIFAVFDFWTLRHSISSILVLFHVGWVAYFAAAGTLCAH
ncbi:kinase-like domain-containing protein [Endogone sp. FLAS-F59071]|nr:kinase-like domain-containing protein [Endogone sp. FLAS-F59071]|eukprot:RUS19577.1 kinase-like domain-containing protein [Endogone sp. FLAS-F59071]